MARFLVILSTFALSACGPRLIGGLNASALATRTGNGAGAETDTGGGGPLAPASLTISTTAPLVTSGFIAGTGIIPGAVVLLPGAGTTPASGAGYAGVPFTLSGGLPLSSGAGATAAGGATATNATTALAATINVSAAWPGGTTQACSTESPFASLTCSLAGFAVTAADFATSGALKIKGYASNGGVNDYRLSNALPVTKWGIRQASNITGNVATNDAVNALVAYNNRLFIFASTGLFRYDATTPALVQITSEVNPGGDELQSILVHRNKLFYSKGAPRKLSRWDDVNGVLTGISHSNTAGEDHSDAIMECDLGAGPMLFYKGQHASGGYKLFQWNEAGSTLTQVSNTTGNNATNDVSSLPKMACMGNRLYFTSNLAASSNNKLFSWDGAAITQLSNIIAGDEVHSDLYAYANKIFFVAGLAAYAPVRYDPNSVNKFVQFVDTRNTGNNTNGGFANVIHNGKLYFTAFDTNVDIKLYEYDDATGVTKKITNLRTNNPDFPTINNFYGISYAGKLYFMAYNAGGNLKIFSYDDVAGTLAQVTNLNATNDINTGGSGRDPFFTIYNGKLYFRAINAGGFSKLFSYDATSGQLVQVSDLRGAANDFAWAEVARPVVYNNRLGFYATSAGGGNKVFTLCDPGAGCTP